MSLEKFYDRAYVCTRDGERNVETQQRASRVCSSPVEKAVRNRRINENAKLQS